MILDRNSAANPRGLIQARNVLDLYERHLAFLYMQQTQPGDSDVSDGAEPEPTWQEDSRVARLGLLHVQER